MFSKLVHKLNDSLQYVYFCGGGGIVLPLNGWKMERDNWSGENIRRLYYFSYFVNKVFSVEGVTKYLLFLDKNVFILKLGKSNSIDIYLNKWVN